MKEKQIEEMTCENCLHHFACLVNSEYVPSPCPAYENKSEYRKQNEGEWVNKRCSICDEEMPYTKRGNAFATSFYQFKTKYCPNCGAKMKGGE